MSKERDAQGRFIKTKKPGEKDEQSCPECGKKLPIQDIRQVHFCSLICEINYRYRMKHTDPRDGKVMSPEEARKW